MCSSLPTADSTLYPQVNVLARGGGEMSGDVAALNYFIAEKYLRAFGQIAQSPNQKILMIPIEAMSVLGSLAGIGEIVRDTFGGSGGDGRAPPSSRRRTGGTAPRTLPRSYALPARCGSSAPRCRC